MTFFKKIPLFFPIFFHSKPKPVKWQMKSYFLLLYKQMCSTNHRILCLGAPVSIHLSYKIPPYHASIIISYDKIYYFYTKIGKIFPFSLFASSIIYQNLHGLYEIPFSGFLYTFCFCITLYTYFAYFHSLKSFSLVQNACFSNILEKP